MLAAPGDANDVTRDFFGDIFRMRDCHNGSRCDNGGRRTALQVPGRPCYCQCAPSHLAYREDKQQCVKDIKGNLNKFAGFIQNVHDFFSFLKKKKIIKTRDAL